MHYFRWIQTGVTTRKYSIWVKIGDSFVPWDLKIWLMTLQYNRAHLLSYFKRCASFHRHLSIQNGVTVRKRQIWVKIVIFFVPSDLDIWRMTLKNNRAPLLCYFKLCILFHSLLWNQNEATVRKHQIWVRISNFLSRVALKFEGWSWKTLGHLFYATSRFVNHFIAIREFMLELQSGNGYVRLLLWPWPLTSDLDLLHG